MPVVRAFIAETFRRNRLLASVAAAHVALVIVLLPLSILDPMQLLGISRWVKPMKFAMSIAIYLGTMAWLLSYLRDGSPRAVRAVSRIVAFTMGSEIILILIQATRGVQSHFNHDSTLDDAIFSAMGLMILVTAVDRLSRADSAESFLRDIASVGAKLTRIGTGPRAFRSKKATASGLLAEEAWRQAEEIGAIADAMFLPTAVEQAFARLRGK